MLRAENPRSEAIPAALAVPLLPRWLVYALLSTLGFGAWGIATTAASLRLSPWQVQVFSTAGLAPLVAVLAFRARRTAAGLTVRGVAWAFLTGLLTAVANVALFAALAGGADASVIFPLTGMYPLVAVVIARICLRERMNAIQNMGVAIALSAILLFSLAENTAGAAGAASLAGWAWLGLSLVALLGWGITGVTQKLATRDLSTGFAMIFFSGGFFVVALAIALVQPLTWDVGVTLWGLACLIGLLFTLASLLLFAALSAGGKVSIVSPLGALYPVITVVAAVPLFDERITLPKVLGIVLAVAAGVALSWQGGSDVGEAS